MLITIIILVLSAVFFVNGKVRSDIVALCALIALLIFQILTPDEALSGFSNSVVIMMIGLFVVGGAIFQTGLAKMISSRILKLAGTSEIRLFLLVMLVTSAIGAFVSNTGTVALMLPIVVSLAMSAGMNPSRLLMPLAFASSMGGMMTLIGTPPNLVIQNTLTSAGLEPLSFFSFLPVGIVCVIVGTLVLMPLSKWFLSKKGQKDDNKRSGKSLKQLVNEYGLSSNLFRLQVIKDSRLLGKTIIDLDIRRKYGLNIMEVRRGDASQHRFLKTITQKFAAPDTMLEVEDILYVTGDFDKVQLFAEDYLLEILGDHATEETKSTTNSLDFYDIGIAEIVLMPSSNLINQTIKEAGFRDKFNVNVLGVRRKKEYLLQDLGNERIHSGDVLLVQGTWNNIARLSKEDADWVVLGQPLAEAAKVTLDYKAPVAAAIMVLMVAMMVFDFIPVAPVTAVMIAGILMVLTGCFRNVEAAYKTINLMSFTSGLGYLGTNILGSSSAEARATGLRGILTNQTNFGPDGVVECGGYNLVGVGVNANNLTDALFSLFDVVYINYVPTSQFGSQDAHKLHNWLKTKKNRVLIASYDASDVSQNLLAEILAGKSGIKYFTSNGGPYPLAASTIGNHYFTTDGPFTKNAPVTSNFALRNYDIYHGEIQVNTSASEGITPILMGPGGGIVLGIDYSRRIVYWGDTDMSSNLSGTGATSENHINNTAGTINNDASKLIANVFAWITETVLYGE